MMKFIKTDEKRQGFSVKVIKEGAKSLKTLTFLSHFGDSRIQRFGAKPLKNVVVSVFPQNPRNPARKLSESFRLKSFSQLRFSGLRKFSEGFLALCAIVEFITDITNP